MPKTTDSRHRLGYSPHLLLEAPDPTGINQLWVDDITYVPLRGGAFSYLATLLDRFSRAIVGWRLDEMLTEDLVLPALHAAIRDRQPPVRMIHHTDRGGQYAGTRYRAVLRRADIRQSMSRTGEVLTARQVTLSAAYLAHPQRFVHREPRPLQPPATVWINPPVSQSH